VIDDRLLEDGYRLHPMQQGMLFHSLFEGDGGVYVGQVLARLPQGVDLQAFEKAWQRVVDRYAALRTGFYWEGMDDPRQLPHKKILIVMKVHDWRHIAAADESNKLREHLANDRMAGFDLAKPPLMRFALFPLPQGEHLFLWTHHHALIDGRARVIVLKEVSYFYEAFRRNQDQELPPPVAYQDYIEWFYRPGGSETEHYWRRMLGGSTPDGSLASLFEAGTSDAGERYGAKDIQLSPALKASLQETAQRNKVTAGVVLQAAWGALLGRYTGAQNVVFGETRACRRSAFEGASTVVGVVMNTVPIKLRVSSSRPFSQLLEELREQRIALREHEHAALSDIREWSGMSKTAEMFDSIVVLEEYELDHVLRREGAALWDRGIHRGAPAHYPLVLAGYLKPELLLHISHDRSKISDSHAGRIAGHLRTLLDGVVRNPESWIGKLPLLTESEVRQLAEWNDTRAGYASEKCIHELFEEQVQRAPEAVAVVFEDQELTYGELNRRANQLAHYLRELGVGPDARVAICVERGLELIMGLLGVLKAGGAYVPLDPANPVERLSYMLEDCAPVVVLTQGHLREVFAGFNPALPVFDLAAETPAWQHQPGSNPDPGSLGPSSRHLAYVIYTSGSTGKPKGVMVDHRAIRRLVLNNGYAKFEARDRVAFASNPAFDATTMEIWAPLLNGARIVVIDQAALLESTRFGQTLKQHSVNILWLTVGLFNSYADLLIAEFSSLRYLIVGGDALDPRTISRVLRSNPPQHLLNGYGPTETTTFAATYEVTSVSDDARSIPIGKPIANTRIYILDGEGEVVPVGVAGEISIGGAGVARGYLNRGDLTAERFVPDPFSAEAGARMYKTGDLGRWRADGNIEFLGRNDFQAKIRGFRIEMGEIEARLAEHPGVREAVVLAREDHPGDKRLVAYITATGATSESGAPAAELNVEALRAHLISLLPEYMAPAAYVLLEKLPLTANGKLDRKALPAPDAGAYVTRGYEAPVGPIETKMAAIWAEVLKVKRIGRYDNFFALGGHSLLVTRVVSCVRSCLGVELSMRTVFEAPYVAELAKIIEEFVFEQIVQMPETEAIQIAGLLSQKQ